MTAHNRLIASSELPTYSLPPGHNLDDGYLKTGIDLDPELQPTEPVTDPQVPLNAAARLAAIEADDPDSDVARTLKRVSNSDEK